MQEDCYSETTSVHPKKGIKKIPQNMGFTGSAMACQLLFLAFCGERGRWTFPLICL